jgi:hypothetical protein
MVAILKEERREHAVTVHPLAREANSLANFAAEIRFDGFNAHSFKTSSK